ncbi:MAG: hypothetical protein KAH05_02210 [Clostridiales bacterium]|nr:hypothetical protein [Clostridiales bacterium]
MIEWILNNKEWVFSGVGVAIVVTLLAVLKRKNNSGNNQTIISGTARDIKQTNNSDDR